MRRSQILVLLVALLILSQNDARAQPKLPMIGFMGQGTASVEGQRAAAFVQRLRELGWIEGQNVAIEFRWAEGRSERSAEIASEFVKLKVDVIATVGTPQVLAAKQATASVPIVSAAMGDPVGTGLVTNLARPGGNVTGLSAQAPDLAGKRLELLREAVPGLQRLGLVGNVENPLVILELRELETAGRVLGLHVVTAELRRAEDIAPAIEALKGSSGRALCRSRPAHSYKPASHQHSGARCPPAGDARFSGEHRRWRFDVLWTKLPSPFPPGRRLRG